MGSDIDDDDNSSEGLYYYDDDASISPSTATGITAATSISGASPYSPQSPYYNHKPRRDSLRKSLSNVLTSPVRAARRQLSLTPPLMSPLRSPKDSSRRNLLLRHTSISRKGISTSNRHIQGKTWQEELDLPSDTTKEQAMAILLCRELENMDI